MEDPKTRPRAHAEITPCACCPAFPSGCKTRFLRSPSAMKAATASAIAETGTTLVSNERTGGRPRRPRTSKSRSYAARCLRTTSAAVDAATPFASCGCDLPLIRPMRTSAGASSQRIAVSDRDHRSSISSTQTSNRRVSVTGFSVQSSRASAKTGPWSRIVQPRPKISCVRRNLSHSVTYITNFSSSHVSAGPSRTPSRATRAADGSARSTYGQWAGARVWSESATRQSAPWPASASVSVDLPEPATPTISTHALDRTEPTAVTRPPTTRALSSQPRPPQADGSRRRRRRRIRPNLHSRSRRDARGGFRRFAYGRDLRIQPQGDEQLGRRDRRVVPLLEPRHRTHEPPSIRSRHARDLGDVHQLQQVVRVPVRDHEAAVGGEPARGPVRTPSVAGDAEEPDERPVFDQDARKAARRRGRDRTLEPAGAVDCGLQSGARQPRRRRPRGLAEVDHAQVEVRSKPAAELGDRR